MADNKTVDLGGGLGSATFATDDIGGVNYERVKLALGPDGTNTGDLAGRLVNSTNGAAYVDARPLPFAFPSTVGTFSAITGQTAVAYAAGNGIGTTTTVTSVARFTGGSGIITRVLLVDRNDVIGSVDVHFWSSAPSWTNAAAAAPADADLDKWLGMVSFGTGQVVDLGGVRAVDATVQIPFVCAAGSQDIVVTFMAQSSFTFAATTDLRFCVRGYSD